MSKPALQSASKSWGNHDTTLADDQANEIARKNKDPETLAKELTDPLIQSIREELSKIDLTKFKK